MPWKSVRGFWKGRRASWRKEVSPAPSLAARPVCCSMEHPALRPASRAGGSPAGHSVTAYGLVTVACSALGSGTEGSRARSWCALKSTSHWCSEASRQQQEAPRAAAQGAPGAPRRAAHGCKRCSSSYLPSWSCKVHSGDCTLPLRLPASDPCGDRPGGPCLQSVLLVSAGASSPGLGPDGSVLARPQVRTGRQGAGVDSHLARAGGGLRPGQWQPCHAADALEAVSGAGPHCLCMQLPIRCTNLVSGAQPATDMQLCTAGAADTRAAGRQAPSLCAPACRPRSRPGCAPAAVSSRHLPDRSSAWSSAVCRQWRAASGRAVCPGRPLTRSVRALLTGAVGVQLCGLLRTGFT